MDLGPQDNGNWSATPRIDWLYMTTIGNTSAWRRLTGAMVTLLLSVAAVGCALIDPNPEAEVSGPARDRTCDSVAKKGGAEIYLCKCVACHGLNGVAPNNGLRDVDIYADTTSFDKFDAVLSAGPGLMPRYPDLDTAARRRLFEYMKDWE